MTYSLEKVDALKELFRKDLKNFHGLEFLFGKPAVNRSIGHFCSREKCLRKSTD